MVLIKSDSSRKRREISALIGPGRCSRKAPPVEFGYVDNVAPKEAGEWGPDGTQTKSLFRTNALESSEENFATLEGTLLWEVHKDILDVAEELGRRDDVLAWSFKTGDTTGLDPSVAGSAANSPGSLAVQFRLHGRKQRVYGCSYEPYFGFNVFEERRTTSVIGR